MIKTNEITPDIRVSISKEVATTAVNNYPQIYQQYNVTDAIEKITNFWTAQMQVFQFFGNRPSKLRVLSICQVLGTDRPIARQFARLCGYNIEQPPLLV